MLEDDPRTSGLALLRATTTAAAVGLAEGYSVEWVREFLLPRALAGFDIDGVDPLHPALVFARAALTNAVERVIYLHHCQPVGA